jgi:hypothetical protein
MEDADISSALAAGTSRRPGFAETQRASRAGNAHVWSLRTIGWVGFLGSCCVLVGVLLPGSPFVTHGSGSWVLAPASPAGSTREGEAQFLGIFLVYLGIVVLLGAWLEALRSTHTHHLSVRDLVRVLAAWAAPIVLAPPLFSRDVYSYAAQGQMVSKGINPYVHGPTALGSGSFLGLVDPLWRHAAAPYGPAWERLSGWIVQLSGHRVVGAIVGFRLVALGGLCLLAWGVPALASAIGRSGPVAFVLGVLNPLVLLVLLGGAHNDILMLGLLVSACALGARKHILAALVLCALAAEVKVPALIAAAFIGWAWWSQGSALRQRVSKAILASFIAMGLMVVIGTVSNLGWRWIDDVLGAGTVVSWLDPATAIGLALGHGARGFGYHGGFSAFVNTARAASLVAALVISTRLLVQSEQKSAVKALGWSLLAFVALGPVVWPWYEAWGFVFLAVVAEGWTVRLLVVLSAIACFADLQSPHLLVAASPGGVLLVWVGLAALVGLYVWNQRPLALSTLDGVP